MKKIYAFTLIELLLVIMILGLILPSIFSLYSFISTSHRDITARENLVQQGYELFERLNILLQDYTIDYEEYYNRQMVGCLSSVDGYAANTSTGSNFKRNVGLSGYCTAFTAYGNENSTSRGGNSKTFNSNYHDIYYCSSETQQTGKFGDSSMVRVVKKDDCGKIGSKQSFGQYKALFLDVKGETDTVANIHQASSVYGDSDDENMGMAFNNIKSIEDGDNIQELYFISHDGKRRLFFRRKLVATYGSGLYSQYKIQMLRLKGFDAGAKHDFSTNDNEGVYDGQIDTRACDAGMGFVCKGNSIGSAYSDYHLPADVDDGWIDLTQGSTSITSWKAEVSPLSDSELSWAVIGDQINAYIKLLVVNSIYVPYYRGKLSASINSFQVPLETTINMKDFYRD